MKKEGLFLLGLLGILTSCSSNTCQIEGNVENAKDGDTLYMARLTGGKFMPTDTIILQGGKFSMEESCDSTIIASYFYHNKQNDEIYSNVFFIEPGNIKMSIGAEGKTVGTQNNDIFQNLSDSIYAVHKEIQALQSQPAPDTEQILELDQKSNQILKEHVERFIDTPCGYFLLLSCYNMFTPKEVLELTGKVPENYQSTPDLQYLKEEAEKNCKTANGEAFIDVTIPSIDGGEIKLSDIVRQHKLTLVDCWASWCGPCRAEMPHVVELYAKYHEKGLEIIGISFDEDEKAWKDAVKEMNMTWPQGSELQSWDNIMTQQYNVTSIPYTILIDQNGTIIAQQLRGKELEEAVKEHLK